MRSSEMPPRRIKARFDSVCPETGKVIERGDTAYFFPSVGRAFHRSSEHADQARALRFARKLSSAGAKA